MSDYKLTFKLKQHTPIIHFQHNQHGATLRSSELKPKLDRFLIENSFDGILNFDSYKEFLIGDTKSIEKELKKIDADSNIRNKESAKIEFLKKQKLAFDYKVSLTAKDSKRFRLGFPKKQDVKNNEGNITDFKLLWDNQFPNYFANMTTEGELKELKEFVVNNELLNGEIIVFKDKLKKIISDRLVEFFFLNNFGTRQNKGFGSFGVAELDGEKVNLPENIIDYPSFNIDLSEINMQSQIYKKHNSSYLPNSSNAKKNEFKKIFYLFLQEYLYKTEDEVQYLFKLRNLFYRIELFYKTLRSGLNIPKLYFKSLMFQYAKSLDPPQQWDKRTIRNHFYKNYNKYISLLNKPYVDAGTLKYEPDGNHEKDKLLFRDLLGLSSLQQWKYYNNDTITKEGKKKINGQAVIQRFKSPITFKPIQIKENIFRVFIFCHSIPDEYLGEEIKINSVKFSSNNSLNLKLPDEFDVCEYIYDAVTLFIQQDIETDDYEQHFKQYVNNSETEEAKYLLDIFTQLNVYYLNKENK